MDKERKICGHPVEFIFENSTRRIIAVIKGCTYDAIYYITDITGIDAMHENYKMRHSYRASATCNPDDEFDMELGRRIAYRRLLRKYLRYRNARIEWFCSYLGDCRKKLMLRYNNASFHASVIDPLEGVK